MTSGKSNKSQKQKTATNDTKNTCNDSVQDKKNDSKETHIDHVKDAKDDTKETHIDHVKDAKDDKNKEEKVNDPDKPIRTSATNSAYSQHFDPIPAENKSNNMKTIDISK